MRSRSILTLLGAAILVSCATSPPDGDGEGRGTATSRTRTTRVTLEQGQRSLSETVRAVGEAYGGNLVVMHGIGLKVVEPLSLAKTSYGRYASTLAEQTGVLLHDAGPYYFLYPDERYLPLLDLSLVGQVPPRYEETKVSLALGDGTQLFNAFSMLSNSLGVSLVADNAVADARCGELVLTDVSLRVCLEAVLQSARVQPAGIAVRHGETYTFFAMAGRVLRDTYLMDREPESGTALAEALVREVRVTLPRLVTSSQAVPVYEGAAELGTVLDVLSSQLGFPVSTRGDAARLPVNPCILQGVNARQALDLLVGQWPTDEYGYVVEGEGIAIQAVLKPGE